MGPEIGQLGVPEGCGAGYFVPNSRFTGIIAGIACLSLAIFWGVAAFVGYFIWSDPVDSGIPFRRIIFGVGAAEISLGMLAWVLVAVSVWGGFGWAVFRRDSTLAVVASAGGAAWALTWALGLILPHFFG